MLKKWLQKKFTEVVEWMQKSPQSPQLEYPEMEFEDFMSYEELVEYYEENYEVGELIAFPNWVSMSGLSLDRIQGYTQALPSPFSSSGPNRYNPLLMDEDICVPVRGPNSHIFKGMTARDPVWFRDSFTTSEEVESLFREHWAMYLGFIEVEVDVHIPISEEDWSKTRIVKETRVKPRWLVDEKVMVGWIHPKNLIVRENSDVSD